MLAFLGYGLHRIWGHTNLSPLDCLPRLVDLLLAEDDQGHRRLLNKALALINDSARQPLICSYSSPAIAAAALYCAARFNDVPFPEIEWWLLAGVAT